MITATERPALVSAYRYRIYGMTVVSEFELRGLPEARATDADGPTLNIVRAVIESDALRDRDPMIFVNEGPVQMLAWATVGAFRIASDDCIEVDPNEGVADSLIALPLLGAVLATLLHRRGLYVLHASAVSVNGAAVALLGDKGAGKSTTAGALLGGGHSLIADDIVALDFSSPGPPVVLPAFAQLKLWDDSSAHLPDSGIVRLGKLHADVDKANYAIAGGFVEEAVPVARLYLLRRSETPAVRPLPPAEALTELLRNSYMARFGDEGFGAGIGTHFQRTALLVKLGVMRCLEVPRGLSRIQEIPALVENDLDAPTDSRGA